MRGILLVLTLLLVSVSVLGCSRKASKDGDDFSCELLQKRAEACEDISLAQIKAGLADRVDRDAQYRMLESRFRKKLQDNGTQTQCEKFGSDPAQKERVEAMKACHRKPGCEAFAKCMLAM